MSFLLLKEIEAVLKNGFEEVRFRKPGQSEGYGAPQFWIGSLPPKPQDAEPGEAFPFIVNRFTTGQDEADASTLSIQTLCGIYTAGEIEAGSGDIVNMIFRCRRLLLQSPRLGGRFLMAYPLEWRLGESEEQYDQPHPYFHGSITTTWHLPRVAAVPTPEEEIAHYGTGYNQQEP